MVGAAVKRFGRVDIPVNNAALFAGLAPTPFEQIEEAEWDRLMAVNVKGVWLCSRAVAPVMKSQRSGRIINIASGIVAIGTPLLMHYVASKGAVIAMTRVLARELGEHGIAVNALAPGLIMSDTARANADLTGFQAPQVIASRAFKREGVADDVVGAAVFLASADSAFITGQTLIVDGGSVFLEAPSPCPLPSGARGSNSLSLTEGEGRGEGANYSTPRVATRSPEATAAKVVERTK